MGVDETKKSYIFLQNRSSGILKFWNVFVADVERKDVRRIFLFFIFFERGSIVVLKMFKF